MYSCISMFLYTCVYTQERCTAFCGCIGPRRCLEGCRPWSAFGPFGIPNAGIAKDGEITWNIENIWRFFMVICCGYFLWRCFMVIFYGNFLLLFYGDSLWWFFFMTISYGVFLAIFLWWYFMVIFFFFCVFYGDILWWYFCFFFCFFFVVIFYGDMLWWFILV